MFGKTLVFACNIEHAETLSDMFRSGGIRSGVVHSRLTDDEQEHALEAFRRNEIDVLVNVAMVTHGIDIPDIATLFLARPTNSEILASQMVGRGSRRTPTKQTFHVVDFVDLVETHACR